MLRQATCYRLHVPYIRMTNSGARLSSMAAHLTTSTNGAKPASTTSSRQAISQISRAHTFTSRLASDPLFPTPRISHSAPRGDLHPRQVRQAFFTFCRPTKVPRPELLGVSPAALQDLGISDADSPEFLQVVSGNKILGWEDVPDGGEGQADIDADELKPPTGDPQDMKVEANKQQENGKVYPWAQCYGGFQFGSWAGQLGDGRALSLFETQNRDTGVRYELQLKGAGMTPYSRFADGRAVLRSSIREFLVSEALNALGIKTTRALSLVLTEEVKVQRERVEPGAIVARFAECWIRLGTFDLLRARGERAMVRQLAEYVAEENLGGWQALASALPEKDNANPEEVQGAYSDLTLDQLLAPGTGIGREDVQNTGTFAQNRFARFYRTVVRRNAATVAQWQVYGFTNGVLNTDNTSIIGLSLDFGPFAFIDAYDPSFTPNHDDHSLRYSYGNQPSIIWWNLVRLGEALGELIGAGAKVDDPAYTSGELPESVIPELQKRGEAIIMRAGEEYRNVLRAEFSNGLAKRLGLKQLKSTDFDELFSPWLDALQQGEIDYNHAYRRLGKMSVEELGSEDGRLGQAALLFASDAKPLVGLGAAKKQVADWLDRYRARTLDDWGDGHEADAERRSAMDKVNPKFLPRNWVLDEIIQRVEKQDDRDVLPGVMDMVLHPFQESWDGVPKADWERWCGDVPKYKSGLQCSCSS